ncbi:MAG: hypothetical protein JST68_15900, partial [Bacteroidetes bacterium]|nr:hypothetical protein [Bacteroidota bacterium]
MTTFQLSPAHPSSPVFPDDDSCFDRTASSSPVGPLETLQQCGVSPVASNAGPQTAQVYLSPLLEIRTLLSTLEQAATLGYNTLHLTGGTTFHYGTDPFEYAGLEQLLCTAKSLGYSSTVTTSGAQLQTARAQRSLSHLDHISVIV